MNEFQRIKKRYFDKDGSSITCCDIYMSGNPTVEICFSTIKILFLVLRLSNDSTLCKMERFKA